MPGSSSRPSPEGLRVAECSAYADFVAANRLYQRVFGYTEPELGLNANLLGAVVRNGGSAVAVRRG
ncbi:MAG: hypothetical protein WA971_00105, partial [Microbacterium sp.]